MTLIRPLLAIAGFALFGTSAALATYDAFLALELERFFPRRRTARASGGSANTAADPPEASRP
jgi:hypothetical protein